MLTTTRNLRGFNAGDMKKTIALGVVGCGYWGPNLVRNFKGLPNCNLKAMCDLSEARLKHMRTLYPDVEGMTDFEHLLNGVGLDAVVVAAPVKHHYSLAKASLLAGKHTLIEKPMASSSAECEELIEIAERNGLVLMVGHTFLYSAPVHKIVEIVQAGDIGEIRCINSRRLNLGLFQKDINDVRVERPPHYDTFADFHYSYHYGDSYIPYLKQEEPLRAECQHFLDCIEKGTRPLTSGYEGLNLVRILEAASTSLKEHGVPVTLSPPTAAPKRDPGPLLVSQLGAALVH